MPSSKLGGATVAPTKTKRSVFVLFIAQAVDQAWRGAYRPPWPTGRRPYGRRTRATRMCPHTLSVEPTANGLSVSANRPVRCKAYMFDEPGMLLFQ
jgi:hypothetical protein